MPEGNELRGDEKIAATDRLASLFETGTEQVIGGVGGWLEGQNLEGARAV